MRHTPHAGGAAVWLWALLLLVSLPVGLCIVLPCLLLCRLRFAFEILALMGGRHRTEKAFGFPAASFPTPPPGVEWQRHGQAQGAGGTSTTADEEAVDGDFERV